MTLTPFICRLLGHKVPHRISLGHPAVTVSRRWEKAATGHAGPIACERCGFLVAPFDKGYPMIDTQ